MTTEQAQATKTQMKRVYARRRERSYLKGLPLVEHFNMRAGDIQSATVEDVVTDEVNIVAVLALDNIHGKLGITRISCPSCGKAIALNKHWDTFKCAGCKVNVEVMKVHDTPVSRR